MNDTSLPFWVTVRRNDRTPKFYSAATTREEADVIAARENSAEVDRRKVRAAERGQTVDQCDKYTYEVVQR